MEEKPRKPNPPTPEECESMLRQKLADVHEDLGDENQNFVANFAITLEDSPDIANCEDEDEKEQAFVAAAIQGIVKARELLEQNSVPYIRPPDMFAEMLKSEQEMESQRRRLEADKERIVKARANNLQRKVKRDKPKDNTPKRPGVSMKPSNQKPKRSRSEKSN